MITIKTILAIIISGISEMKNEKMELILTFALPLIYVLMPYMFYNPMQNTTLKVFFKDTKVTKSHILITKLKNELSNDDIVFVKKEEAEIIVEVLNDNTLEIESKSDGNIALGIVAKIVNTTNIINHNKPIFKLKQNIKKNENYILITLLPGLLFLFIMQMLMFSVPKEITSNIEKKTLELYMTTNISKFSYLFSLNVMNILRAFVVAFISFILMFYVYKLNISANILFGLLVILISILFFTSIGIFVGTLVKKESLIFLLMTPIMLVFMFFTPIFYSLDKIPVLLKPISSILPTTLLINQFRELFFGFPNYRELFFVSILIVFISLFLQVIGFINLKWYKK